jgi:hypothetical protein
MFFWVETPIDIGKSPPDDTGVPTILRSVGSFGLILNIDIVFEPAFELIEYQALYKKESLTLATKRLQPDTLTESCEKSASAPGVATTPADPFPWVSNLCANSWKFRRQEING